MKDYTFTKLDSDPSAHFIPDSPFRNDVERYKLVAFFIEAKEEVRKVHPFTRYGRPVHLVLLFSRQPLVRNCFRLYEKAYPSNLHMN
ncbi:hypothetical protein IWX83_000816 [Flavobacterium sp. CG_9.1]|uniref:hypothetical protein n=1 Tax=Flavobacterium sp. CG_9.1 TaxID=2787728 RepID=UPI0018CA204C|nr:hypothetical protein [Flavobacterium sp. CG_9.1]MBG6061040.1 hypothetical protein [Flavobacterium sp. CG_9.1]